MIVLPKPFCMCVCVCENNTNKNPLLYKPINMFFMTQNKRKEKMLKIIQIFP